MYLGSRPRRRSPRLTILLLLMILAATLFVHYIATYRPDWSKPFEPSPTPTRPASWYVAEAEAYYGEGQLDQAINSYQQAVTLEPDNPALHTRLAHFLILRERTAEAYGAARTAVQLAPSDPQALGALCRALDWEGLYARALEACECATELQPNYAEAYAYLSEVYADVGNWSAARKYAQQAVDLNYQSVDAHRNLGYAYEMQGRFAKAIESYENALYLQPRLATLYLSAARNYRALGKYKEAIDRLERVIRFDPNNPVAYDQLGWTYYMRGEYRRAAEYLEQATAIDPLYTPAWGHLGIVSYITQQYEDAIEYLRRAIDLAAVDYLDRARQLIVVGSDASYDPPRPFELLRGEFLPLERTNVSTLTADLRPVPAVKSAIAQPGGTCGDRIAAQLAVETFTPPPGPTASPDAVATTYPVTATERLGEAVLNVKERQLEVRLHSLGQPAGTPLEVQMLMWPGKTITLGTLEVDPLGNATFSYSFEDTYPAPIEYYYSLGFAYIYLDQCAKGVPWLRVSLTIDSSAANPAWQGLDQCPGEDSTDLPRPTPAPE
jgi:tetratricopeptide (TPR) repeat protein